MGTYMYMTGKIFIITITLITLIIQFRSNHFCLLTYHSDSSKIPIHLCIHVCVCMYIY